MERIKVEISKDCNKGTPEDLLLQEGFSKTEYGFVKDNKCYKFYSMDRFNSYVYSITLQQIA